MPACPAGGQWPDRGPPRPHKAICTPFCAASPGKRDARRLGTSARALPARPGGDQAVTMGRDIEEAESQIGWVPRCALGLRRSPPAPRGAPKAGPSAIRASADCRAAAGAPGRPPQGRRRAGGAQGGGGGSCGSAQEAALAAPAYNAACCRRHGGHPPDCRPHVQRRCAADGGRVPSSPPRRCSPSRAPPPHAPHAATSARCQALWWWPAAWAAPPCTSWCAWVPRS